MRWYPFFALCLLMASAHGQSVFECKQKDGTTVYQDMPCPGKPNDPPAMTFAKPAAGTITPQQRSQAMVLIEHLLQIRQFDLAADIARHNGLEPYLQQRMFAIAQQDAARLRQGSGAMPPLARLNAMQPATAMPAPIQVGPRLVSTPSQAPAPASVIQPGGAAPPPILISAQRPVGALPAAIPANAQQANLPAPASQASRVECLDKTAFSLVSCASKASELIIARSTKADPIGPEARPYIAATRFIALSDGALVLSGEGGRGSRIGSLPTQAWVMKLTPSMHLVWEQFYDLSLSDRVPILLVEGPDNRVWSVDEPYSQDSQALIEQGVDRGEANGKAWQSRYEALTLRGAHGELLWKKSIAKPGDAHQIYCGAKSGDDLILTGWKLQPGYIERSDGSPTAVFVPWIEKIDKNGAVLWQTTVQGSRDMLALPSARLVELCSCVQVSAEGVITWAITSSPLSVKHDGSRALVRLKDFRESSTPQTLLVQLDAHGKQLRQVAIPGSDTAFLYQEPDGLDLIEHVRPRLPDFVMKSPPAIGVAIGIPMITSGTAVRITKFDQALNRRSVVSIKTPEFDDHLNAALPMAKGGYLLAGCAIKAATNYAVYVDAAGTPGAPLKITEMRCGEFGLAYGSNPNEAILYSSSASPVMLTMRLQD